jgi:hypothetical protein
MVTEEPIERQVAIEAMSLDRGLVTPARHDRCNTKSSIDYIVKLNWRSMTLVTIKAATMGASKASIRVGCRQSDPIGGSTHRSAEARSICVHK